MSDATVIRVADDPSNLTVFADFFDGKGAAVRRVEVLLDDEGAPALVLDVPSIGEIRWPLDTLRQIPDQADDDKMVLTATSAALARLILTDPGGIAYLERNAPYLHRRPPVRGVGRILAWAAGAIGAVALIVLVLVPALADRLAVFIPPAGEKALGDTTLEQVRAAFDRTGIAPLPVCEDPDGLAALATMEARLIDGVDLPSPLTVTVLDHDMINAFALPGGHVVFFSGLIERAGSAEEVAAVFAHEVGHVVARDPTRIALRSAGSIGVLGLLLGDFAGGAVVLFLTEAMIRADYTQEAEAAADTFAHNMLRDAGISPAALGTLFDRLRANSIATPDIIQHFESHPELGDRIAAAEAAAANFTPGPPLLTDAEWAALQDICG